MKIEVGKSYMTRDGGRAAVVARNARAHTYPLQGLFGGNAMSWTDEGRFDVLAACHPLDLVADWIEDRSASETTAPDDNPKTAIGLTKPPIHAIPPAALLHLGAAMADGEAKYGLFNWRERNVSSTIYYDAAMRHLMAWWDGERAAPDSGIHHLGHVMACCAILLDAEANGTLNDNRGPAGPFAKLVVDMTRGATVNTGG